MLNDYSDLAEQARLFEKAFSDSKALSEIERSKILKVLNLAVWDIKKVVWRIRKYKFLRPVMWSLGGLGVGVLISATKF